MDGISNAKAARARDGGVAVVVADATGGLLKLVPRPSVQRSEKSFVFHEPGLVEGRAISIPETHVVSVFVVAASADDRDAIVRDLLGRAGVTGQAAPARDPRTIEVNDLRIHRETHRVTVGEEEILLTALEFKLLITMAERCERVQTRGVLLRDVWNMSERNATRSVDTLVKRLRTKLRSSGHLIQTVRGVGYRLSAAPAPKGALARERRHLAPQNEAFGGP
jgi:DNA-binding winged helix-turn-helix (wHTH) protein